MDKHTPKERRQDRVEEVIHEVNIIIIHQGRPNVRALGDKTTVRQITLNQKLEPSDLTILNL